MRGRQVRPAAGAVATFWAEARRRSWAPPAVGSVPAPVGAEPACLAESKPWSKPKWTEKAARARRERIFFTNYSKGVCCDERVLILGADGADGEEERSTVLEARNWGGFKSETAVEKPFQNRNGHTFITVTCNGHSVLPNGNKCPFRCGGCALAVAVGKRQRLYSGVKVLTGHYLDRSMMQPRPLI